MLTWQHAQQLPGSGCRMALQPPGVAWTGLMLTANVEARVLMMVAAKEAKSVLLTWQSASAKDLARAIELSSNTLVVVEVL